jgi:hypothetical protein
VHYLSKPHEDTDPLIVIWKVEMSSALLQAIWWLFFYSKTIHATSFLEAQKLSFEFAWLYLQSHLMALKTKWDHAFGQTFTTIKHVSRTGQCIKLSAVQLLSRTKHHQLKELGEYLAPLLMIFPTDFAAWQITFPGNVDFTPLFQVSVIK